MLVEMVNGMRPGAPGVVHMPKLGPDVYEIPDRFGGPIVAAGHARVFRRAGVGPAGEPERATDRRVDAAERRGGDQTPSSSHQIPGGRGSVSAGPALPGISEAAAAALAANGVATLEDLRAVIGTDGVGGRWNDGMAGIDDAAAEQIEAALAAADAAGGGGDKGNKGGGKGGKGGNGGGAGKV